MPANAVFTIPNEECFTVFVMTTALLPAAPIGVMLLQILANFRIPDSQRPVKVDGKNDIRYSQPVIGYDEALPARRVVIGPGFATVLSIKVVSVSARPWLAATARWSAMGVVIMAFSNGAKAATTG